MNFVIPMTKYPPFQNEAKWTAFLVELSFTCIRMKYHFHIKG